MNSSFDSLLEEQRTAYHRARTTFLWCTNAQLDQNHTEEEFDAAVRSKKPLRVEDWVREANLLALLAVEIVAVDPYRSSGVMAIRKLLALEK